MAPLLFAAALGCEIFLFNFPFFATRGYQPVDLSQYWDEASTALLNADGSITLDAEHSVIRFNGMEQPLYNLQIDGLQFSHGEPYTDAQNPLFSFTIYATDEGASVSRQGWSWDVAWKAPRSWTRTLDLAGNVSTLTLDAAAYDGEYIWYELAYTVGVLRANVPRSFVFSPLRLLVLFGLLLTAWGLRPSAEAWQEKYLAHQKKYRPAAVFCGAVLALLVILTPLADPQASGLATRHYNVNSWDEASRVSFTYHISDWQKDASRAQYGSLAHAFLNGRLDLLIDPPEALARMNNPYDTGLRAQQAPDALWDAVYYQGRYYVYFGVVPCLLFQLPFELLTGVQDLPNCIGMIVMSLLLVTAVFGLVHQTLIRWFPDASAASYLLISISIVSGSQLYFLLLQSAVYEYAILCGAAFVMLGLWQWLSAANLPPERRGALLGHLMLGSLCIALVAGCRPQMELFAFLALPIFWQRYVREKRLCSRQGAEELALFILPALLVAAGLMWYNAARFGSPFDFGANYNLTSNDMTSRGFKLGRIAPALFTYFLQLPAVQAVFPYLQGSKMATNYAGITITEVFYGGMLVCAPMLWALLVFPSQKKRLDAKPGLSGVILWSILSSVLIAAVNCEMAGVLYRYLMDFSLPLLFAAGLCWLQAEETLCAHRKDALSCFIRPVRLGLVLSAALGALYSFCVVFGAEPYLFGRNPALFQTISRTIQFWL